MGLQDLPHITVATRAELRRWLKANHANSGSIWLVTYKKSSGKPHVGWSEIVEEALCFGWIDSRPGKVDAERSKILLSPRKKGSAWSKINKEHIEKLLAAKRMAPAGIAKIEQAKADGSWTALDEVEAFITPPDLAAAFAANPAAKANWDNFAKSARRGILDWIRTARKPETRANRIRTTVDRAAGNRRATYPE